jgi:apurinic endonuclease APN1
MHLGAHESIAGGLELAIGRAEADTCQSAQIFTRSGRSWLSKPLTQLEIARFSAERTRSRLPVVAHGSYLVNLASDDRVNRQKSIACFADEVERVEKLGCQALILHPGSNAHEKRGLKLIAEAIDEVVARTKNYSSLSVLEVTAGQGSCLGHRFEHLAEILSKVETPERLGICLDTCHLFAAGYDISTEAGYHKVMDEFDRRVGLKRVKAFHLNDSKKPLGSRVDRHENIGEGTLGLIAFRCLINDARFQDAVGILETPSPERYKESLALLRSLEEHGREVRGRKRRASTVGSSRVKTMDARSHRRSNSSHRDEPDPAHNGHNGRSAAPRHESDALTREKVERLVKLVQGRKRPLILTHDNPDPDSLASATALAQIFEERCGLESRIAFGGIVGRAENRAMIRVLKLPVVPISRVVFNEHDLIAMVDTQPAHGNHSLPLSCAPDIVIDHHPPREESWSAPFADVGGAYGATSTILVEYLRAAGLEPTPEVATALFYGIKSDTRDLGRETGAVDIDSYLYLFPRCDKDALAQIEYPLLPPEYFRLYHQALERARVYGDAVAVDLGNIYTPDMVAEIADHLLSLEGMKWSLAYAAYEDQLFFSLRVRDRRMNAGRLIREICEARGGSAGGHGSMAGARLPLPPGKAARTRLKHQVLRRFLAEFGAPNQKGVPLMGYAQE